MFRAKTPFKQKLSIGTRAKVGRVGLRCSAADDVRRDVRIAVGVEHSRGQRIHVFAAINTDDVFGDRSADHYSCGAKPGDWRKFPVEISYELNRIATKLHQKMKR